VSFYIQRKCNATNATFQLLDAGNTTPTREHLAATSKKQHICLHQAICGREARKYTHAAAWRTRRDEEEYARKSRVVRRSRSTKIDTGRCGERLGGWAVELDTFHTVGANKPTSRISTQRHTHDTTHVHTHTHHDHTTTTIRPLHSGFVSCMRSCTRPRYWVRSGEVDVGVAGTGMEVRGMSGGEWITTTASVCIGRSVAAQGYLQ